MDGDGPQPSAVDLDRMGTSTKAMLGAQASSAALVGGSGNGRAVDVGDEQDPKAKKGPKAVVEQVSYFRLYRFATPLEVIMVLFGTLCALAAGALQPLSILVFGNIIDAFGPSSDLLTNITTSAVQMTVLGCISFVCASSQVTMFVYTGSHQASRIRALYFRSILRQEMQWYDGGATGELTTRISGDVNLVQTGISEKVGSGLQYFSMFLSGFVIGFVKNWKLSLVILSVVPLLVLGGAIFGKLLSDASTSGQAAYAKAGGVAEEVLGGVRTIAAFSNEDRSADRYRDRLNESMKTGIRKGHFVGLGLGMTFFVMFASYGLAFWYGSVLINDGEITAGEVVTVFFCVIFGSMALGQGAPSLAAIATARGAAFKIFQTIDREPLIDSLSDVGTKLPTLDGNIAFENVRFHYPTRPGIPVLQGLNLTVKAGQTVALVGHSGCGKSTTVSLLERFYDPPEGRVTIDGVDVRTMSIKWLRSQIGIVSQEPVLFNKTIAENILMGKPGASQAEVEEASRAANAHDFISKLPLGYGTVVGERGAQLSGGQKQRIAIARALIRNPKILLLDEATSALDTKSERIVQDALDRARKGRTSLVIAHRLSTIRDADVIAVIDKGRVAEQGDHAALMALNGLYAGMVTMQTMRGQIKRGKGQTDAAADVVSEPTSPRLSDADENDEDDDENGQDSPAATTAALAGDVSFSTDAMATLSSEKPARAPRRVSSRGGDAAAAGASKGVDTVTDAEAGGVVVHPPEAFNYKNVFSRAYTLNRPEWFFIMMGTIGAAVNGAAFPVYSIIFSDMLSDMLMLTSTALSNAATKWALIFLGFALIMALANYLQNAMYGISGERLTWKVRQLLFRAILRQEMGWFDRPDNTTGALATKLSNDASAVQGMTGANLGLLASATSTLVTGMVIAFVASWRLSLVVLAALPLAALGGAMEFRLAAGFDESNRKSYERSGQMASEAVGNIRTVVALGMADNFLADYQAQLNIPLKASNRKSVVSGVSFGFSQAVIFFIWALAFYYGALLTSWGLANFNDVMKAISAIIFSGMILGQTVQLAPDFSKARTAAAAIFGLLDRKPAIDSSDPSGRKLAVVEGRITFQDVKFQYPNRPDVPVLRGLSFTLEPGKTLALVGSSGCGKSTVIALVERFYDPASGQILVEGVDTRDLNLSWLRSQVGLVQQEPILFLGSIGENIRLGKPDATQEEVEAAAKEANAHNFIVELTDGYNTQVGEKGAQLSGGQKQRIAIARALVRNPKVLLLDEATSALDSESEKVVQEALDRARKGRACITIAHRLSTIQDADAILVLDGGVVVEQGTHNELIELNGRYASLVKNQAMTRVD